MVIYAYLVYTFLLFNFKTVKTDKYLLRNIDEIIIYRRMTDLIRERGKITRYVNRNLRSIKRNKRVRRVRYLNGRKNIREFGREINYIKRIIIAIIYREGKEV